MELAESLNEDLHLESQKDMYLTFHVMGEDYAMDIRYVSEIIGMQEITEVPEMPKYIKGMINLRGRVIPVMDIRARFSLPEQDYTDRTCIIVTSYKGMLVGLVVDTVREVTYIEPGRIDQAGKKGAEKSHFVQSLGKLDDGVKIILDLESVLGEKAIDPEEDLEIAQTKSV